MISFRLLTTDLQSIAKLRNAIPLVLLVVVLAWWSMAWGFGIVAVLFLASFLFWLGVFHLAVLTHRAIVEKLSVLESRGNSLDGIMSDPVIRMTRFMHRFDILLDSRTRREIYDKCIDDILRDYINLLASKESHDVPRATMSEFVVFTVRAVGTFVYCLWKSEQGQGMVLLISGIVFFVVAITQL